jgi:cytochrome c-type biogenesis protein CcmH
VSGRISIGLGDGALLMLGTIVVIAFTLAVARPTERTIEDRARALDAELRCPVCQGTSIDDSPVAFAAEMRAVVREHLAAGASDQDVRDYFVERYGVWILLAPPARGFELALWLAPGVVVAGGAFLLARRARRPRGPDNVPTPPAKVGLVGTAVMVGAIGLALGLPLALALGPRGVGAEITGRGAEALQAAPSLTDLEAAVARDPADVGALVALGDAYLGAERAVDAGFVYSLALKVEPENVPASIGLGTLLLSAGRPADAQPLFDRVLTRLPDQPDALLYRALARYMAGDPVESVRADALRFLAVAGSDPRRAMAERLLDVASPVPSP